MSHRLSRNNLFCCVGHYIPEVMLVGDIISQGQSGCTVEQFVLSEAPWQVLIRAASCTTPSARNQADPAEDCVAPLPFSTLYCCGWQCAPPDWDLARESVISSSWTRPSAARCHPSNKAGSVQFKPGRLSLSATQNDRVLTIPLHPQEMKASDKHACTHPWTHVVTQLWLYDLWSRTFLFISFYFLFQKWKKSDRNLDEHWVNEKKKTPKFKVHKHPKRSRVSSHVRLIAAECWCTLLCSGQVRNHWDPNWICCCFWSVDFASFQFFFPFIRPCVQGENHCSWKIHSKGRFSYFLT